jgi:carbon storage regulator CsrA
MLVLDRKEQEGFWIDGRIYVKVLGVGRRRVKIGIVAPPEMTVVRDELQPDSPPPSKNGPVPEALDTSGGPFQASRRGR